MDRGARRVLVTLAAVCLSQWLIGCGGGSGDGAAPPAVVACPATALPSGAASTTLAIAAWPDRDYDLMLPASYRCGQPIAVAIVFHGGGGNKANIRQTACPGGDLASAGCIDRTALAAGMAVVFPNGTKVPGSDALTPAAATTATTA